MGESDTRPDQRVIVDVIEKGATVLDLGCGQGELLVALIKKKQVRGQGIEIDDEAILHCVALGLNVFHDDLDRGLSEYSDQSFDYVILNQTFQQVRKPDEVLRESLRVGRKVIIGFPKCSFLYSPLVWHITTGNSSFDAALQNRRSFQPEGDRYDNLGPRRRSGEGLQGPDRFHHALVKEIVP